MTILPFSEFLPDLPAIDNPGVVIAENVIPAPGGYRTVPDLEPYADALPTAALGAFSCRNAQTAVTYNFVGTAAALYSLGTVTSGVFEDVSKAGGYTASSDDYWEFTQFGNFVIATDFKDAIQSYELGVSTDFADLTATSTASVSAPKARYIDVVRTDFLVVANTNDPVDGYKPYRVRWCGLGSRLLWKVSATTQADYQDLDASYGWINKFVGGDYGTIFQERAITRMDYIGSPAIFQFTIVEREQGTKYPRSVVKAGSLVFFLGLDGFRVWDGTQSVPIGQGKVDNFFLNDLDTTQDYLISSAVDFQNRIVMWAYPSIANGKGSTTCSRILYYNYSPNATQRWSYSNLSVELLYTALSEGYTIPQLDDWESANNLSKNIDILPYSLDSRVWVGNSVLFGAFTNDHRLAFNSTVAYLDATIETQEAQLTEGQKTELQLVRPAITSSLIDTAILVKIGTRNKLTESVQYTDDIPLDADGNIQCRQNARYHRAQVKISGGFSHAVGIEVLEFQPTGYR